MPPAVAQATFKGYAAASRFMNIADGFMIFRRFGELHNRNLLHMQCQLSELEAMIHERDLVPGTVEDHGTFRYDQDPIRKALMKRLRRLIKEYDEAVLAAAAMRKIARPKPRVLGALESFMSVLRPIVMDEEPLLDAEDELLSFKSLDDSFPTWVTEKLRVGDLTPLTRSTKDKEFKRLQIYDLERLDLKFINPPRIHRLMRILVTTVGCLFLLVPIILLYFLRSDIAKLSVIICSLVIFTAVTAAFTSAKNWEVVAALTAYAAVLVVFVNSDIG